MPITKDDLIQAAWQLVTMANSLPDEAEAGRIGKWVDREPGTPTQHKSGMAFMCSACGHRAGKHKHLVYRYCPWCGARMEA